MTAKQKAARAKFKAVVAEAKKLRKKNPKLTQAQAVKQAFAISYSKSPKTKVSKKSGKKLGALPSGFKGKIMDISFQVSNQYDVFGNVSSIIEDIDTGRTISIFDGKGTAKDKAESIFNYISKYSKFEKNKFDPSLKTKLNKFANNLHSEVKSFNAGKKKTIKPVPLKIDQPKIKTNNPKPKKSAVKRKTASKQKGSSSTFYDKLYQAKKPGKRKTAWGTTYYESRANRSDKGVLLGTKDSYHKDTKSHNVNIRVVSGLPNYKNAVKVYFKNRKYNYTTTVGANVTEEDAKKYFLNKYFNVGTYPKEILQKPTKIKFFKYIEK